tara:strand:+ start:327 stop:509 length:183 start_codon:yes stop_codon:yes gene_type:complete
MFSQESQLLTEDPTTFVVTTIVIAQDHGQRQGQGSDPFGESKISITEITDHKQTIGIQPS